MSKRKLVTALASLCLLFSPFLLLPTASTAAVADVNWPSWDNDTPEPHTVFGEPVYIKHDPNHNIVRRYQAFTVYYDDQVLSPRWTAIKITCYVADKNSHIKRPSRFQTDMFLKQKGYQVTKHEDYSNPRGVKKKWDRGHMVQFDDARGYGEQAAKDSLLYVKYLPATCAIQSRQLVEAGTDLYRVCTRLQGRLDLHRAYLWRVQTPFCQGQEGSSAHCILQDCRFTRRLEQRRCPGVSLAAPKYAARC